MTDPNTPVPGEQPPAPRYGEYAPAPDAAPQAPAYTAPAYAAAPAYPGGPGVPAGPVPGKTLGIVAFVVSFFAALIGLILGIIALVQSKKAGRGNGFAVAAIIIGAVATIVSAIFFFALVLPSITAATTCLNDPTAIVTVWGVDISCTQVLESTN